MAKEIFSTTNSKVIGTINSMQTLVENFPTWKLPMDRIKTDSINFIVQVLHQLGINDYELIDKIIYLLFNTKDAVRKYAAGKLDNLDGQSDFLINLENQTKFIIAKILSAILSCSIIPKIPEEYFDDEEDMSTIPYNAHHIPLSMLDSECLLHICPTTNIGRNFYLVDKEITPNSLYKSKDLNAMMWYALNRGTLINESEKNKMMWDSRFEEQSYDDYVRDDAGKWNYWLNSTKETGIFSVVDKQEEYEDAYISGTTISQPLHPIMQFYPTPWGNYTEIFYTISKQTFSGKTIYDFNEDYLNNIQIFNPKSIIASMIDGLLNCNIKNALKIETSLGNKIMEDKINQLIARALEVDDENISDCFFTFSNDELNEMLEEMERQKYSGKELNSETAPSILIDENYGLDLLNQINSTATINEKLETLTRSVYEISTIPNSDSAIQTSDKLSVGFNTKWFNDVIMAIIKPMVKSILSPKVMLLFIINFDMMGLIYLDDIKSFEDVMKIFYRKLMSIILSLVSYVKDQIIKFLIKLFEEKIQPLLEKVALFLIEERLVDWTDLLLEAALCIVPTISLKKTLTEIDDVRYADITQEQITPETTNKC